MLLLPRERTSSYFQENERKRKKEQEGRKGRMVVDSTRYTEPSIDRPKDGEKKRERESRSSRDRQASRSGKAYRGGLRY